MTSEAKARAQGVRKAPSMSIRKFEAVLKPAERVWGQIGPVRSV